MAPLPESSSIKTYLTSLLKRTSLPQPAPLPASTPTLSELSPKAALLLARAQNLLPRATTDPSTGVTDFDSVPNKAVFIIFGLIGAGFVLTGIWFFFWAKNGGFHFKENDWDEYKSTVLRRKGPNGTTLSGATASTDLGGGSVVHGGGEKPRSKWGRKKKDQKRYKDFDEESSEMTGSAGGSSLGSEMSELKWKIRSKKKEKKESRLRGGDLADEYQDVPLEDSVKDAVRAYRHEKPARVGGLNKESDASAFDGSTNDNSTAADDLLSHREFTPTNTPTKIKKERKDTYTGGTGGIRKVVSTSTGGGGFWNRSSGSAAKKADEDAESERIKSEAKKLQEKGRAVQRRDFSFQQGDDSTVDGSEDRRARREERDARRASRSPTKKIPGSYYAGSEVGSAVSSDLGTKSYHHPIPGLSSTGGSDYVEEKRKKRANGGYRRERRDSLDDDGR